MKLRHFYLLFILVMCSFISSCSSDNETTDDAIVGKFTWAEWKQKAGWADYSASDYTPANFTIEQLNKWRLDGVEFIIFGSNWCHLDCEPMMPKIMKLLELSGYDQNSITIYGLSRNKKEPAAPIIKYDILYVPTIVMIKEDATLGKVIAESDNTDWEQEILNSLIPAND